MVQAALHDEDVFAAIGEGKFAAIGDGAFRGTLELREQAGREVHAFDASETEALEGNQTVSAAAKKFNYLAVARPVAGAQAIEARDKFLNFLFWPFESQIGGFPRIRSERVRCVRVQLGVAIFHLGRVHLLAVVESCTGSFPQFAELFEAAGLRIEKSRIKDAVIRFASFDELALAW